jgi:predicted ribonuclease toxin of YeeF-YezG toxin-antitoxin module
VFLSKRSDRMTDKVSEAPKKAEETAEELPEVDEATVGQLSEEVC